MLRMTVPDRGDAGARAAGATTGDNRRLSLLAEASRLLGERVDGDVPVAEVLRLALREFADAAFVDLIDEAGALRRAAHAGAAPLAISLSTAAAAAQVRSTGRPILAPLGAPPEQLDAPRPVGRRGDGSWSVIIVPLIARGEARGVLTLAARARRTCFSAADLDVAIDLGARIAAAVDNARLYRTARQAAAQARDLLSVVAHDLRGPVHAIRLSAMDLSGRAPAMERRTAWPAIDRVRRLADHIDRMIDDLSDRAESSDLEACGGPHCQAAAHDVPRLLDSVLDALAPLAREKGVTLRIEAAIPACAVACDEDRVLEVFTNLIANAVRFTPRGGVIELAASAIRGQVRFSVRDGGPGVAPADLDRLFDRRWQARKGTHNGGGLGLYIARRLIEAQGGRIWCEGAAPGGATMSFTLPLADPRSSPW